MGNRHVNFENYIHVLTLCTVHVLTLCTCPHIMYMPSHYVQNIVPKNVNFIMQIVHYN